MLRHWSQNIEFVEVALVNVNKLQIKITTTITGCTTNIAAHRANEGDVKVASMFLFIC